MALSSRLKLWEQKIKEEKKPPATSPPPAPLSVIPGGFLKQLVRETEKETRLKEPELKDEKAPCKLSENLVQQFLVPDQTPPILEAEMALRAEQLATEAFREQTKFVPRAVMTSDAKNQKSDFKVSNLNEQQNHEGGCDPLKSQEVQRKDQAQSHVMDTKEETRREVRPEPVGQLSDETATEQPKRTAKDVWFDAGTVWHTHKKGFTLATQLIPDEGASELPDGKVRIRLHTDDSEHEVTQFEIEKVNPPELDLCEDLCELLSMNESSVLHTLTCRAKAHLSLTNAGPNMMAVWPPSAAPGKGLRSHHWDAPAPLQKLVQKVHMSVVSQRRDQCVVALGRSGTGKTTICQSFALELLKHTGTEGGNLTAERLQAVFTVLRSFGGVKSPHSDASSRFAMVLSLDYNHKGHAATGHLQTMMLEKWRVFCRPDGESNFLIFSQMLAGLSPEKRTELHLHQLSENNSFGITCPTKVDEKQRAAVEFGRLLAAMNTLGFSSDEQQAIWHVLAGIYHLGVAGASKVGRKQFMSFESAQVASIVLGCQGEELHTAVFKHHLRKLLQQATGTTRGRHTAGEQEEGLKLSAAQCVTGMASGLYEELFTAVVYLINRALGSQQLTLGSVMVVDTPGVRNPRHGGEDRAAGFSEFCHNYLQERLLEHYFKHTFTNTLERYSQEGVSVDFEAPEKTPEEVVCAIDQPGHQVRSQDGDCRGLLWVLDEEMGAHTSTEGVVLERVCQHFGDAVRQCEQPLQCEIAHRLGADLVRYDLTGWFGFNQNNPSALNAISILQNSSIGLIKSMFAPRASVTPVCRSLGGVEGGTQRCLERSAIVRKTFSGGMASIRRYSHSIAVKLQADALINLIRRTQPLFLQCLSAKADDGNFDFPSLRAELRSTHMIPALQLYRIGFPNQVSLSDFRRRFQALCPSVLKSYGSVFIMPNERKAVEELLVELDLDKKSIILGKSRVFMKRNVLKSLEEERDELVSKWLVQMQSACRGHQARQKYRHMKVQRMAVKCIQRNVRLLSAVSSWSWWKLLCKMRPVLDKSIDDHKLQAKEDEVSALRRRLEKSEKVRNELRQTADNLESKVAAVMSELSDERFWGEAVSQALDTERAERLRLNREKKELQTSLNQSKVSFEDVQKQLEDEKQKSKNKETPVSEGELQVQLDCAQTEMDFLRKRLRHSEEKLVTEKEAQEHLNSKVSELQAQLEQWKRSFIEQKRLCQHVTLDLQDASVLMDSLQTRVHELERKQRRFDGALSNAFEETESEREQKDKVIQENISLRAEIFSIQRALKKSQAEVSNLQIQKTELCTQIGDLTGPSNPSPDSVPELKKQLREFEIKDKESAEELTKMMLKVQHQEQMLLRFEMEIERMKQMHQKELEDKDEELEDVQKSLQRRLRQLEMQLEQEYEEKQMVVHEKHDLEGLIATLCEQVGHRDFDVEKRLRRDLKRTHALLSDAQLLLSTIEQPVHGQTPDTKEQLERMHRQLEESEARRLVAENVQKTLSLELENAQLELESICKTKSLVDEQLNQLQYEKTDLLKRLEEDQEDLNELMKKHKTLIAQSSSDITQIRELQAELEEVKRERQNMQEQLQISSARVQFLESSTVFRSIVSKQEAHVCDLENKLEFQRGQIKRFEVIVLRLRDSIVRLGEELEQSVQAEVRERENSQYYQQRLAEMRLEVEDLSLREQDSSRRRMELEMQVEELSAVQQTLQADLKTAIQRIADLQVALEDDDSGSDSESVSTAYSSVGREDAREGIKKLISVPPGGRQSFVVTERTITPDLANPYSFRSSSQDVEDHAPKSSTNLARASSSTALSELLEGLRKKRIGWNKSSEMDEGSTVSLPIYQTTGASALRRRTSNLSKDTNNDCTEAPFPGIPTLQSTLTTPSTVSAGGKISHFRSSDSLLSELPPVTSQQPLSKLSSSQEVQLNDQNKKLSSVGSCLPPGILKNLPAEADGEPTLWTEPLVFQNQRLFRNQESDKKMVEGETNSITGFAIQRSQSINSLASNGSRGSQRRALSVHFGELPPSRASLRENDLESLTSEGSQQQKEPQGERLEADGSEEDINLVMKKYLRKSEVD